MNDRTAWECTEEKRMISRDHAPEDQGLHVVQVSCVTRRLQSRSAGGKRERAKPVLGVPKMRALMPESTRRSTHSSLTSQAELMLSGAVLGDLRGKMVFSGSDACEDTINTPNQLDLTPDLTVCFEGVRCEADTDTNVRFDRGEHGSKKTVRTQDADEFPWRRTFSPAQGEWQSSSDRLPCCVQICWWSNVFHVHCANGDVTGRGRRSLLGSVGGTRLLSSMTRRRASFAAAISLGLSTYETDKTFHSLNKQHLYTCAAPTKTMVVGCWLGPKRACKVERYDDIFLSHPGDEVVSADVSLVDMAIWTNSPESTAELGSRCY